MKDGGPAFPMTEYHGKGMSLDQASKLYEYSGPYYGMSLRDYFAAKAMQVEFETACRSRANARALGEAAAANGMTIEQRVAFNAYAVADAMLAERAKGA